jgi:hypothetical protein
MSRRLQRARQILRQRLAGRGLLLLAVVGLVLLPSWLSQRAARVRPGPSPVALDMQRFPADRHGTPATQDLLRRTAEGRATAADRERLMALADEAVAVSDLLEPHDPGRDRAGWQRHTRSLREGAFDLKRAARAQGPQATALAAARLYAACTHCHDSFRD